ncbi:hypothetical protein [Solimonas sp. SE-A11]|uniref:hypothetical protein n=1 Tax=Solimonas sp. SE-A11 TaxID=3054954 RepID=UPI00259CBE38|nr:hypothetical protein [Solimonas sp. SE-A11]MDM4771044.1 hypothetical protein [Solimonas sp. SE-A11]
MSVSMRLARRAGLALAVAGLTLAAGCGSSRPVDGASGGTPGLDHSREFDAALMPSLAQVRGWQYEIDSFDSGFRPAGSVAEIAYAQRLASQLRAMGVPDVRLEPYPVDRWIAQRAQLQLLAGDSAEDIQLVSYIPFSGNTGPGGLEGPLVYVPGLAAVDLTDVVVRMLDSGALAGGVLGLVQSLVGLLGDTASGLSSIVSLLTAADVRGKIVVYDLPRLTIPIGVLSSLALHVTDDAGTMGFTTPFSRPFLDMVVAQVVTTALKAAGAAGAVGIVDYPQEAAQGSYYPFFARFLPASPTVYLDRDTGAALKQRLLANPLSAKPARLTLHALEESVEAYNVVAVLPGASPLEIVLSSHTDGTNSIEDNGPAAILGIMRYFTRIPQSQRKRSLRVVFSGGHFGGGGLGHYIEENHDELQEKVLAAIEVEHVGAREWLEIAPGVMGLTGLNEPQVIMTPLGEVFERESILLSQQFDRSIVMPPLLPFGEGQAYRNEGGLPVIQYITGPVYLLNFGIPKVTSEFTDYPLMHAQVGAFVRMILNLGNEPASALRSGIEER